MASLKDMRTRIASVKATRKITKAMQMVAAAKLRRAQDAATAARPQKGRMTFRVVDCGIFFIFPRAMPISKICSSPTLPTTN